MLSRSRYGSSDFKIGWNSNPLSYGRRHPPIHDAAVRNVDAGEPSARRARGRCAPDPGRDHRLEQRERERDTGATQQRASRKMLAGQVTHYLASGKDYSALGPPDDEFRAAGGRRRLRAGLHALLERVARDDRLNERGKRAAVSRRVAHGFARDGTVVVVELASERVGHQPLGQRRDERVGARQERAAQVHRARDLRAVGELRSRHSPRGRPLARASGRRDRSSRARARPDP